MTCDTASQTLYGSDDGSLRCKEEGQFAADIEPGSNTPSPVDRLCAPGSHTPCEVPVDSRDFADANALARPVGCPSMGKHRPLPPQLPDPDAYIVEFDGPSDLEQPYNWKLSTKSVNVNVTS